MGGRKSALVTAVLATVGLLIENVSRPDTAWANFCSASLLANDRQDPDECILHTDILAHTATEPIVSIVSFSDIAS